MPNFEATLIGRGATGTIYRLSTSIVLKIARRGDDEEADHAHEQKTFEFLEKHSPIPHLVRCLYRKKHLTFLDLACNGSLAMLLDEHQRQDRAISQIWTTPNVHRWMRQLCQAVVGLERLGLVHGDIRPSNILFDDQWNLVLSDLDRSSHIGQMLEAVSEPFGRLLGKGDGDDAGTYGKAGARTETFAIGSVYYTLLRGYEPFQSEHSGRDHDVILVEKLQKKEFPPLTDSAGDGIIHKCWHGLYQSAEALWAEFKDGDELGTLLVNEEQWLATRRSECAELAESGDIENLDRY